MAPMSHHLWSVSDGADRTGGAVTDSQRHAHESFANFHSPLVAAPKALFDGQYQGLQWSEEACMAVVVVELDESVNGYD